MDYSFLNGNKVVPVVVINKIDDTDNIITALLEGGIKVAEITFRTACAKDAIAHTAKNYPEMLVGAGTIINGEQCKAAIEAGAKFIVSPGFSHEVLDVANKYNIPYLPGVVTPTEIMDAIASGLEVLKFFPAGVYGGIKAIKALSAAFPSVKFMPTGGVDLTNLADFLRLPCIVSIGGSFMFKGDRNDTITKCREALKIVEEI